VEAACKALPPTPLHLFVLLLLDTGCRISEALSLRVSDADRDAQSPSGKHYTWTNIRKYTKDSPLLPSGLLGPVVLRPVYKLPLD
jgi:integrase